MSLLISCPKKFTSQPCKSVNEIALQKGKKRAVATIKKNLTAGAFRPDLEQVLHVFLTRLSFAKIDLGRMP